MSTKDASHINKTTDDPSLQADSTTAHEPVAANMTMPLSQNIEVTNDDDGNETMPLMFSCKQRRLSKLNFKRGATAE